MEKERRWLAESAAYLHALISVIRGLASARPRRGTRRRYPGRLPEVIGDLTQGCRYYTVPEGRGTPQLYLSGQDPEALVREAQDKGRWRAGPGTCCARPTLKAFHPLLPLRSGAH